MTRKLGLRDYVESDADLKVADFYASAPVEQVNVPSAPFGMFGNDQFGDCYWASAANEVLAEAYQAGRAPQFDTESVLSSYAAYLGVEPTQLRQHDQGTDARKGAKWRAQYGVNDTNGHGHKIGAYAFITVPDPALIKSAVRDFEGVTVCVNLPESAERDLNVWDYVAGSPILGGHAIAGVGVEYEDLVVISWGHKIPVTDAFIEKYLQCVVCYISGSTLNDEGKTVRGLDKPGLRRALDNIQRG
jgi:hypothetical protein